TLGAPPPRDTPESIPPHESAPATSGPVASDPAQGWLSIAPQPPSPEGQQQPAVASGAASPAAPPRAPRPGRTDALGFVADPASTDVTGGDGSEVTPIFEEIASAWFRSKRRVPVEWASGGP